MKLMARQKLPVGVNEKIVAVLGWNDARRLPHAAFFLHALVDVFCKGAHVLHDALWLFENVGIDAL